MTRRRFGPWVLPLLMLAVLMALLMMLILYPARSQRRPELLEMSVISREADGSAWATARQGMEQAPFCSFRRTGRLWRRRSAAPHPKPPW